MPSIPEFGSQKRTKKATEFSSQARTAVTVTPSPPSPTAGLETLVKNLEKMSEQIVKAGVWFPPLLVALPFVTGTIIILNLLIAIINVIASARAVVVR